MAVNAVACGQATRLNAARSRKPMIEMNGGHNRLVKVERQLITISFQRVPSAAPVDEIAYDTATEQVREE